MNRRRFLRHTLAYSGLGVLSSRFPHFTALAQTGESRPQFFIFVFAQGGWDTTMVFEPKFGLNTIDVDPAGVIRESHGIQYVDNPNQPAVARFFDDYGNLCCVINGINSESISHFLGKEILMTGKAGAGLPDWPSIIASENGTNLQLPNMALSGPSFPRDLARYTYSGSGFLSLLLTEGTATPPSATAEVEIQSYIADRFTQFHQGLAAQGRWGRRADELVDAYQRVTELSAVKDDLGDEFRNLETLTDEGIALCSAMEKGYSVAGTLNSPAKKWDSHSDNYPLQHDGYETLFDGLHNIVAHLASRPATSGSGTMLDQTMIVVLSEMSRTPKLNGTEGKDHWQFTSALMIGARVRGGTVLGGTDDLQTGLKVDYSTGLPLDGADELKAGNLGAGLIQIAGIDPALFLGPDVTPFTAFVTPAA